MTTIKLTKNVLVFKHNPDTGYLEASRFEIRAGAEIEVSCSVADVQMPNGAICEKRVVSFEEPWSRQTAYLLVEEMGESESAQPAEGCR